MGSSEEEEQPLSRSVMIKKNENRNFCIRCIMSLLNVNSFYYKSFFLKMQWRARLALDFQVC